MYTDADIITELEQNLGEEIAQLSVERILRVPHVWDALRRPDFLRIAVEAAGGQALFPSMLAALSMGVQRLSDVVSFDEIEDSAPAESTALQRTAKQAIELMRIESETGARALIEFTSNASDDWRSAFICAWPEFEHNATLLEIIAENHSFSLGELVASTMLAYMSTQQAAAELLALESNMAFRLLPLIQAEPELYDALRSELVELSDLYDADSHKHLESISRDALILSQLGRVEDAHKALRSAWDVATRQTAEVADRLAAVAKFDGDPILEVEARQQALDAYPTLSRRSTGAYSLLQVERYEEALNLVRDGDSFEENVVSGLIFLAIQDTHTAGKRLNQAAQQCMSVAPSSYGWFSRLADGLKRIGFSVQAIRVYEKLIERYPARADLRVSAAELMSEIGDFNNAIEHACIATALNPEDLSASELLANNLEQVGDPKAALPHWKRIAEQDLTKNIQLGHCALAAEDPELAQHAAERVLEENPKHVTGLVLSGRALSKAGKHSQAKAILKDVTERSPEDAEAWIALASSMEATDEPELAGQALQDALHALPDNANLHMARAAWLKSVDRLAEALDHSNIATSRQPDQTDWQLQHAELLNELGRHEDAKLSLEKIVKREPANWNASEQLARTYEQLDEVQSAISVIQSAPENIAPESAFYVGRLLTNAGTSREQFQLAARRLTEAKNAGLNDPSLNYWMGVSGNKLDEHQSAAKHFLRYLEAVKDSSEEHYLEAVVGFATSALENRETTLALTQLEKAKPSFPTSMDLLMVLSDAQFAAGDQEKSLSTAREALELYPDTIQALAAFKIAAERADALDEASTAQRKITAQAPGEPEHWLDTARIEQRRGEETAAREALARAITLGSKDANVLSTAADLTQRIDAPGLKIRLLKRATMLDKQNDEYQEKLASAAADIGDLETASKAWLECARRKPQEPTILLPAAKSLWKLNRRTAAIGLLQQAATIAPENATAHLELGRALIAMGDIDRGLNEISRAVSLEPENSVMRAEVSSLLAKHVNPDEGLSMLDGSTSAGKFPDVAETRAECFWLNGMLPEAEKSLSTIPPAVPLSIKGTAVRTLVKLAKGDNEGAQREFDQIMAKQISSPAELEWVVKSGLALGDIERTALLIQSFKQNEPVAPETLLVELQASIQIKNLTWLNSTLAHSSVWDNRADPLENNKHVDELVAAYEASAVPDQMIRSVKRLRDLSTGRARADSFESIERVPGLGAGFVQQCQAIALLRANRPLKAIKILDRLPDGYYDHSLSALLQGLAHVSADQIEPAKAAFRKAAQFGALKPLAHYFEASMWEKAGAFERAISSMNEAIALSSSEAHWHSELASIYESSGQVDAALPHLQQAAELAPEDGQILIALARAYRSSGQLSDAEELYARSLQSNPLSPKVWKEAGQVALAGGDNDRAEAWFERACTLLPADAICVIGSARSAQMLGKNQQALQRARKAYDMAPDDPVVLSGLGDILAANGSLEKAIQIYDRAMQISDQSPDIRLARSKLLMAASRPQDSISDLEQLVEIDPDYHEAWETLAVAHADCNEYERGLHAAQQAVNISPRNVEYKLLQAKLCRQAGQLDQALDILSEIEHEAPERVDVAREKGIVHEARRDLEMAIDSYNRALAIDSQDAETVIKAGLLLKQVKAYEESAALLERGTELRPDDADLHQQLAAVRALQFVHGHRIDEQVVA